MTNKEFKAVANAIFAEIMDIEKRFLIARSVFDKNRFYIAMTRELFYNLLAYEESKNMIFQYRHTKCEDDFYFWGYRVKFVDGEGCQAYIAMEIPLYYIGETEEGDNDTRAEG